jgi:Tol biopolymer transport system component
MRKALPNLFIIIGLMLVFLGCDNGKLEIRLGMDSFDITPDGKYHLYISNTELLVDAGGSMEYYNPKCSEDGKRIVFISSNSKNPDGPIWICDVNGKNLEQLTDGNSMIIEAIFSLNGDSIYFTQAEEYDNNSPIARKAPHKFDIYSINLNDKTIEKRTEEAAYSIYNLSDVDSNRWLLNLNG